jgi:hypothetical protein
MSPWAHALGPRSKATGEGAQRVRRFVTRPTTIDEETMGGTPRVHLAQGRSAAATECFSSAFVQNTRK